MRRPPRCSAQRLNSRLCQDGQKSGRGLPQSKTLARHVALAVNAAERFAELLDFGLGNVLFVLGFGQLLRDVVEIIENAFEGFADAIDLGFGFEDPRALFRR